MLLTTIINETNARRPCFVRMYLDAISQYIEDNKLSVFCAQDFNSHKNLVNDILKHISSLE